MNPHKPFREDVKKYQGRGAGHGASGNFTGVYLKENQDFEIDTAIHSKLLITVAPDGYLRRVH